MIGDVFDWLTDPAHWTSTAFDTGIWDQLLAHIEFTLIALAISLVIALPARAVDRPHRQGDLDHQRRQRRSARCRPSVCSSCSW